MAVKDNPFPDEPLNPVQAEAIVKDSSNAIARSIRPVSDAYDEWTKAKLEFKRAYAVAYGAADGSIEDRKQKAVLDTVEQAEAERVAEAKYRYLKDFQDSYRDKLSSSQTLYRGVQATYGAAGVTER